MDRLLKFKVKKKEIVCSNLERKKRSEMLLAKIECIKKDYLIKEKKHLTCIINCDVAIGIMCGNKKILNLIMKDSKNSFFRSDKYDPIEQLYYSFVKSFLCESNELDKFLLLYGNGNCKNIFVQASKELCSYAYLIFLYAFINKSSISLLGTNLDARTYIERLIVDHEEDAFKKKNNLSQLNKTGIERKKFSRFNTLKHYEESIDKLLLLEPDLYSYYLLYWELFNYKSTY